MRIITGLILLTSLAAAGARGDILVTRGMTYTGQVIKVTGNGFSIKVGDNEFIAPRADIVSAVVAKPDGVD